MTYKPASQLACGLIRQVAAAASGDGTCWMVAESAQPRTDPAQTPRDTTQYCGADRELLLLSAAVRLNSAWQISSIMLDIALKKYISFHVNVNNCSSLS